MIELRNLTKYYPVQNGVRYVLRDVSLVIPSHVSMGVLGPNGAGKSTLLRLLGGAEPADSGTIITDQEISWQFGLTSGFQGSLTGRQNILFVCRINGLGVNETREVIRQVTAFAEIGEYFDMPVSTYSSGMRSRLSFGLSMAFEFDVYLVDELTSVGDMIFREKAQAAFERIRKRASLIFVSHNLKTLKLICQSALFLRDGEATFYPDIDEGIEAYTEYIRLRRNHGNPTTPPKESSRGSAEKIAARQAARKAKRSADNEANPGRRARNNTPRDQSSEPPAAASQPKDPGDSHTESPPAETPPSI